MIKHILKLIWNKRKSNALMILEIFLSFIVLFFVLSYVIFNMEIVNRPLGFETEDRWVVHLDQMDQKDSLEGAQIITNLESNLLANKYVEEISFSQGLTPFNNSVWQTGNSDNGFSMNVRIVPVDENYGSVLGINLTEGRWFEEEDLNATYLPVIVNQNFMEKYYPEKSMLDSIIILDGEKKIIGIVDDYRYFGEFEEPKVTAFIHYQKKSQESEAMILKMKKNTPAIVEQEIAETISNTMKSSGSMITNLDKSRKESSRESWMLLIALLSICGFLCINVALGLFGVLWYNINKRKSEIGLRQALGAHTTDISKQFLLEILLLAFVAVTIGIFFTVQIPLLKVTEYPNQLFYKAILFSSLIILVLVLVCALFPSIQASRIRPANALHDN